MVVEVPLNDSQRLVEEIFRRVFRHHVERVEEEAEKRSDLRVRDDETKYIVEVKGRREDEAYERALQVDPASAEAHSNIGVVYFALGRFEGAIRHFRKAVESRPEYGTAYANMAAAYARLGQHEEAVDSYQRALALDPEDIGARFNMGLALKELGRTAEAVECFRKVLELSPDHPRAPAMHKWLGTDPQSTSESG